MAQLPRPTHRRTAALCAALALVVLGALVVPGAHADGHGSLKQKKHHVHGQVRHAQGDLDGASKALRAATGRLSAARKELHTAKSALAGTRVQLKKARAVAKRLRAQLHTARTALAKAQAAERAAEAAVAEQRRQIGVFAAHNYMYGDPQLLRLSALFSGRSIEDISSQVEAANSIADKQDATLARLHTAEIAVSEHRAEAAALAAKVATQEKAAAANLAVKKRLKQRALAEKNRVAKLVASRRAAKSEARKARAHDLAKLRALKRREERIKRQILARARGQKSRHVANTGGLLYRPVPGYVTSPYGWRKHPIYGYWGLHDGDDFHAPCGTPERAAGRGTVISEYYSSVWGNRLYLDLGKINGHNFTVIYNHIERYAVRTGARVYRGQTVAYAGTTGWSTGCHLHFTVMRDGTAVDPMDYM